MGVPGPACLSTNSYSGQSGDEAKRLPLQENHSDCSGEAQHALVLGPICHIKPGPIVSAQSAHSAIPSDSTQESVKPKSLCLAPRVSPIKEQVLSEAVTAQIKVPQRGSARSATKWTILVSQ